jgi:hypothetical protein
MSHPVPVHFRGAARLVAGLLLLGAAGAQAAAPTIWRGRSGGFSWTWSARDLTATRGGSEVLSLRKALKISPDREIQTHLRRSARLVSLVGPLASMRIEDEWDGGAHPSGATTWRTFDARRPSRVPSLTDYIPYGNLRGPLFADRVIGGILRRKGLRTAPATAAQLEAAIKGETFSVGEIEHQFGSRPLSEFSFHHLDGRNVGVRLHVGWAAEVYRFRTTQIGLAVAAPPELSGWLRAAAGGREGFLQRSGAARFKDRSAVLFEWSRKS